MFFLEPSCGSNNFQCDNKEGCILRTWKCDGLKDCSDGSDEKDCREYLKECYQPESDSETS